MFLVLKKMKLSLLLNCPGSYCPKVIDNLELSGKKSCWCKLNKYLFIINGGILIINESCVYRVFIT